MTTTHTPTPWKIERRWDIVGVRSDIGREELVASTGGMFSSGKSAIPENEANAEFIVRAVNAHDDLLAACEVLVKVANEARDHWDAGRDSKVGKYLSALAGHLKGYRADVDAAHAAIAKATGQ